MNRSASQPPPPHEVRSSRGLVKVPAPVLTDLPIVAAKTAGKTKDRSVPQPALRKKQTAVPRGADSRSAPALPPDVRAGRFTKRVRFSCRNVFIPQVFSGTPPDSSCKQLMDSRNPSSVPDPFLKNGSSRPTRVRNQPDRYGFSRSPTVSRLGGEL